MNGWELLDGSFGLPDLDDEHLLAAAVVGAAGAIVTDNLKHFPSDLIPSDIQVLRGREFAANTADVDPQRAARALCEISARRKQTKQTPHELVQLMVERYQMHNVADIVLPVLDEVSATLEGHAAERDRPVGRNPSHEGLRKVGRRVGRAPAPHAGDQADQHDGSGAHPDQMHGACAGFR